MSTDERLSTATRNECIADAFDAHGRPPTARQAAEHSERDHNWFHPDGKDWDAVLREAGVPNYADVVAEAIRERYAGRYPWQEFIIVRAGELADDIHLGPSHTGQKIGQLADGERASPALDGLVIRRCATGNGHTKWRIETDE